MLKNYRKPLVKKRLAPEKNPTDMTQPKYEYIEAFAKLETSESGLSDQEVEYRLKKYGPNSLKEKAKTPLIIRILAEFKDLMVIILIIAATVALFAHEVTDSIIIYLVVLINGFIGFIQKYKAEKAIEALKKMVSPQARVIRQGTESMIDTKDIVPGDILVLNEGDNISADAIIFESNEFQTQEAPLTGESTPINKLNYHLSAENETNIHKTNWVFMGTAVSHGNAKAIVAKTGMDTEFGKIANLTQATNKDKSPLEKEIHRIGLFSAKVTFVFSIILLLLGYFVHKKAWIDNILFTTSVAVAAVPEGLPATITIALALGVQKLSRQKAIVKQLSSVETLGATTVICTDKTGTLTKNEMTVTQAFVDQHFISFDGENKNSTNYQIFEKGKQMPVENLTNHYILQSLEWLNLCAFLCNNAKIIKQGDQTKVLGDPTEGALLVMAEKFGFDENQLKNEFKKIHELPFDSERKRMTTIVQNVRTNKVYAFTKGAPDQLIKACDQKVFRGKTGILTKDSLAEFLTLNEEYAKKALRTIGFAFKELPLKSIDNNNFNKEDIEKNLILIGLVGMIDPPRPEVKEAVELTRKAGIRTYVMTGDHGLTAQAIAMEIGIVSEEKPHEIITGDALSQLSAEALREKLHDKEKDIIFARISPEHKLKIVTALKENGEIVAVTGDGVNDAPALKRADIGVAMGITGTDVSKEAANMVLSDDSFSTIVTAIKEGRTIYNNLKKFIFYIFSSNVGEVTSIFLAIALGLPGPFTAVLILCINLVTDLFPALALAVEPTEAKIMDMPPRPTTTKIMDKAFIKRLLYIGISIGLLVIAVIMFELLRNGWYFGQIADEYTFRKTITIAFGTIVFIQLINTLNARSETSSIFQMNFLSNKKLTLAILSSALIGFAIIELPFLQTYLETMHLDLVEWSTIFACGMIILMLEEIRKAFLRRKLKLANPS